MIRAVNAIAAMGMVLFCVCATAAPLSKGNLSTFGYNQTQKTATITPNGTSLGAATSPISAGTTQIGQSGWHTGTGAAWNAPSGTTMLEHNGNVFLAGTKYPFQAGYKIPNETLISAAASLLGGPLGAAAGIGLLAYPHLKDWLNSMPEHRVNSSTGRLETNPNADYANLEFSVGGLGWFSNPSAAAEAWASANNAGIYYTYSISSTFKTANGAWRYKYTTTNKQSGNPGPEGEGGITTRYTDKTYEDWLPASMNDIAPYLARAYRTPSPEVAKEIVEAGGSINLPQPNIKGPSQIVQEPVTKTTQGTTNVNGETVPTTTTTTTSVTNNFNITNNQITNTSNKTETKTTVTNSSTGQVVSQDTKTETEEPAEKEEPAPADTPLGDIPELYKQKYPNGIGGVINTKIAELKATPLFNLPSLLMPSLPSSGSCPSWQIDLALAGWADMGTHTVQAPCMVWDFGKVIIIVSALLLARRLIFGG